MTPTSTRWPLLLALSTALLGAGCGGGGSSTVSSGTATNNRYAQTLTISFSGQGLDQNGIQVKVDGPCESVTKKSGSASALLYTCFVTGVGRVTPYVVDSSSLVLASLKVDIPLPLVSVTVTDGTREGSFVLELDPTVAPYTVSQFIGYMGNSFYTGTTNSDGTTAVAGTVFHRVRTDLAILGGGYSADTSNGVISAKLTTAADLKLEVSGLKNLRGTIAMYHEPGKPDSANSMFFINTVDNPKLDRGSAETPEGFTVFGRVVEGMTTVVDEIAKVPVRSDTSLGVSDVPVTPVRIKAMSQTR